MALFGKGAPLLTLLRRAQDRPFDALRTGFDPSRWRDNPAAPQEAVQASSGRAGEETGFPWMTSRMRGVTRKRGEAKVG